MKDLAIYGSGGLGREVACLVKRIIDAGGDWNLIGFFDDTKDIGTAVSHYGAVLGGIDELNKWEKEVSIAIAVGAPGAVRLIREKITNPRVIFPNIIDPSFYLVDIESFNIGMGNIIQGAGSASCDVSIGDFNLLNGDIVMGHDVKIGNFNAVMPDIRISGCVEIGDDNFLGVGSIIIDHLKVGNGVHLGAGAVLMTKPKDYGTYLGNPAKLFKF